MRKVLCGSVLEMKIPEKSPDTRELFEEVVASGRFDVISGQITTQDPGASRYLHWDQLRHRSPPHDWSHREWWLALKFRRLNLYRQIPLTDVDGNVFQLALCDPIPEWLHKIDQRAAGRVEMHEPITNSDTRDRYLVGSLIEESITSSQLEGAATTRPVAKEMIRTGRAPRDLSERMILNNYHTMQRIATLKKERLTRDLVLEIHRLVTNETLDDPSGAGRFRRMDEPRVVVDSLGSTVFHTPPPASELDQHMEAMCDFGNAKTPSEFLHPVLRSIILHFWMAYDHPFLDGNGRTARALFYWSMLHHDFWLCEFISISQIILKAPTKYGRAFLYTETDDNDLTYFSLYHLEVIQQAIDQLYVYIKRKTNELRSLERELRGMTVLNARQRAVIGHACRHPLYRYTIESHRLSHAVVYQTARTDLLDLEKRGLFTSQKIGRTWHFTAVSDLEDRLRELS